MSARCYRDGLRTVVRYVLLLSMGGLLLSCSATYDAELVILTCLDQDGNPLPPGVNVSVDGISEIWNGAPLRFPVKVEGDLKLVTVEGGDGNSYVFNSKSQVAVRPGKSMTITLRFFRPYTITVEALGREMAHLSGVDVYANGVPIGTTDERGRFIWQIDQPGLRAGVPRAGTRFAIALERNGEWAEAGAVVLAEARFAYTTEAQFDQDRLSPYYGLDVEGVKRDEETATPPPDRPSVATTPRRPRTEPTPAQTPPRAVPLTEVQPRPLTPPPIHRAPVTGEPAASEALTPEPTPTEPAALSDLQKGDEAFATGGFEEARRLYSSIPPGHPDFKRARQKLGEIYFETKNFEGAIAAFEDIIRHDPSEYAAYNNLAAVYLATESYDEALDNLDKVLARKHLIPRTKRRDAELEVRYTRAAIHFVQFQNERDPFTKKEQGLLAMSVLQFFIDRVPPNHAAFQIKQQEIQDKLDDIRDWVWRN